MRMRCPAVSSSPLYLASSPSIAASSRLICEMRALGGVEALLGVLHAVVLDLEGGLQLAELAHDAGDRPGRVPSLQRAFDALAPRPWPRRAWRRSSWRAYRARSCRRAYSAASVGAVAFETRQLIGQRRLLAGEAGLAALRGGDALLLLLDAAVARLDLVVEVLLDLAGRALRRRGELVELRLVGVPAFALEQRSDFCVSCWVSMVAPMSAMMAETWFVRAQLRHALALLLREDDVEAAVEREEHRRRHAGEEHHPQHGVLGDDAQRLRVGRDDVGAGEGGEQAEHAEQQRRRRSSAWIT